MDYSMKHYQIMLWGYGGEAAYLKLNKEQYEYWKEKYDEDGDEPLLDYMLASESWCEEDNEVLDVPPEMDFMLWANPEGEQFRSSWYEAPTEFCHQYGVGYDCRLTVNEVESGEYNAKYIADVIDSEEITQLNVNITDESDGEDELIDFGMAKDYQGNTIEEPEYVCQFWSAEKGTFFEGFVSTEGDFDIKKLKIYCEEFPNGDDTVVKVEYDGEEVDNMGGDTNGKGYSAALWSNV
jgi:hypothetical protein